MGVLFGREKRLVPTFPEPPIPPYPGADPYGGVGLGTIPDRALQVPTVWACVGLLANTVSSLPLETFRKTNGVPARITDPPLVAAPSSGLTQSEWLHSLMVSLLTRGNAYGRVVARDDNQRPLQIELLHPDLVVVDTDRQTGRLTYKMRVPDGTQIDITDDIWHVRGLTMPGTKVGLSPISYAAATIGVDLYSRQFASQFFEGGGIPKAIIKSSQEINQTQAQVIKDRVLAAIRGRDPLALGDGVDYQQIQIKPEESQFLATQQANVAQIARFFWVPPEMVGGSGGNSMTYANVEQRNLDFLTYSIAFWLKRIEDAFFPLLPRPQYAKFDVDQLLRTDVETTARVDVQLIAAKIKTPSEVRNDRGLPPMTDDQKAEADMVPLTVTPTGGAKALPALKEPPGPVAPVPADDQGAPNAA